MYACNITRDSVRRALVKGISAKELLRFLQVQWIVVSSFIICNIILIISIFISAHSRVFIDLSQHYNYGSYFVFALFVRNSRDDSETYLFMSIEVPTVTSML